MKKEKIEEILLNDVTDFFANIGNKKPNFIRTKSFLEGVLATEKNEKTRKDIRNTLEDFEMYEGIVEVAIKLFKKQSELEEMFKELKHETEKNHNNNLQKIVELGKGIDKLDKKMNK